jgi:hypothetical protein
VPLAIRLGFPQVPTPTAEQRSQFVRETADSLNQLWPVLGQQSQFGLTVPDIIVEADLRVRRVLSQIDGKEWEAAKRIKHSVFADWWFRVSGIDGMFNPFATNRFWSMVSRTSSFFLNGPRTCSRPRYCRRGGRQLHRLPGNRGSPLKPGSNTAPPLKCGFNSAARSNYSIPDPGGTCRLSTRASGLSRFLGRLAFSREFSYSHLRANGVEEGIESYSQFIALAIATQDRWEGLSIVGSRVPRPDFQ